MDKRRRLIFVACIFWGQWLFSLPMFPLSWGQDQTESDTPWPYRRQECGYRLVIDKNLGHSGTQEMIQTLGAAKLGQPFRPSQDELWDGAQAALLPASDSGAFQVYQKSSVRAQGKVGGKTDCIDTGLAHRIDTGLAHCIDTGLAHSPVPTSIARTLGLLVVELYLHPCLFRVIIRIPANQCCHSSVPELCSGSKDDILISLPGLQCASPASLSNLLFSCEAQGAQGNHSAQFCFLQPCTKVPCGHMLHCLRLTSNLSVLCCLDMQN